MALFRVLKRFYENLIYIGLYVQSFLLLAMRLYWGYHFVRTGTGKLAYFHETAAYFAQLGIPYPNFTVYLVGWTETICGSLLMAGLISRVASIPLICILTVAYLTAHLDAVEKILSDPAYFIKQDPFLFLLTCVLVFAFGPGKISFDYLIGRLTGWGKA